MPNYNAYIGKEAQLAQAEAMVRWLSKLDGMRARQDLGKYKASVRKLREELGITDDQ